MVAGCEIARMTSEFERILETTTQLFGDTASKQDKEYSGDALETSIKVNRGDERVGNSFLRRNN